MLLLCIGILWVACSVIGYGYSFGYYQRRFPNIADFMYRADQRTCMLMAITGPVNLLALFACDMYKHGTKWR